MLALDARLASSAVSVAIALHGVSAGYSGPVLRDIDLEVANEVVAVVGRSGSGKTTLLRLIAGLLEPTSGTVDLLGVPPAIARRRKRIGFVCRARAQGAAARWRPGWCRSAGPAPAAPGGRARSPPPRPGGGGARAAHVPMPGWRGPLRFPLEDSPQISRPRGGPPANRGN